MDKALFGNNCEGNNVINGLIEGLINPQHPHSFVDGSMDFLQDHWEEAQAYFHGHEQMMPHIEPNLAEIWNHNVESLDSHNLDEFWKPEQALEDEWAKLAPSAEAEQAIIKDSAANILSVLRSQGDSKFTNSEFFKFVSKLETGAVKIEGQEVVENFEDVWTEASKPQVPQELWNGLTPQEKENFEQVWQEVHPEDTDEARLLAEWGKAWQGDEKVEEANPYENMSGLQELYQEMLKKGEFKEGIQMMEAELASNPSNTSECLALGKLYSYMDRDDLALKTCLKGLEADPYNLDLLMSAAVASIGEFDLSQLPQLFSNWLEFNVDYAGIQIPKPANLEVVKQALISALDINAQDHQLYSALGLIEFANCRYEEAEYYFLSANSLKPGDCEIMNRIAAALMQQTKYEHAVGLLRACLASDPEYVRARVNLGKCFYAMGDLKNCVSAYLTAAQIYPDSHLFELARSVFAFIGRDDLVEKIKNRNPMDFVDEFDVGTG